MVLFSVFCLFHILFFRVLFFIFFILFSLIFIQFLIYFHDKTKNTMIDINYYVISSFWISTIGFNN